MKRTPSNIKTRDLPPFAAKVVAVVRRIPKGQVRTYKQVAKLAGRPKAYRAVGNIMNRYGVHMTGIPCHRVVRSDGSMGGYRWGIAKKRALLKKEGARI
jgi:AraC family transcriptional regulator of adaptative response/methylated-DNA-[protein]-cysteine methyltransferase